MIELRYVERWESSADFGHLVKCLQYRVLGEPEQTGETEFTRAWSDWLDVPTVKDSVVV